jgi:hypothetical protein
MKTTALLRAADGGGHHGTTVMARHVIGERVPGLARERAGDMGIACRDVPERSGPRPLTSAVAVQRTR